MNDCTIAFSAMLSRGSLRETLTARVGSKDCKYSNERSSPAPAHVLVFVDHNPSHVSRLPLPLTPTNSGEKILQIYENPPCKSFDNPPLAPRSLTTGGRPGNFYCLELSRTRCAAACLQRS